MLRFCLVAFVVLAAGACAPSRPPWADGAMIRTERVPGMRQDLSNLPARLLALHNEERRRVGAAPLAWDAGLAQAAAGYGPALERLGRLAHSPRESRPGQGENLWMGSAGAYDLEEMAGSWAEERRLFVPGIFPAVSRSGQWSDVAHYTQMIWPTTRRIGCAVHRAAQWDYLVCRYAPGGNVDGTRLP